MKNSLKALAQSSMGALRIPERVWFQRYQKLLLAMSDTAYGRDLLGIPQEYPQVISISRNRITMLVGFSNGQAILRADCRIGSRFGDIIRSRFSEFTSFARYFLNGPIDRSLSPTALFARSIVCDSLTSYPDPHPEEDTFDGSYKKDGGTYAAAHDSATANLGLSGETGTTFGIENGDEGTNNFYVERGATLFDTSLTGLLTAAELRLICNNVSSNETSDSVSIVSATTASNTTRTDTDFAGFGTTKFATDILISDMTTGSTHTFAFNASGLTAVNIAGITKIGIRTARDVSNTSPGTGNECQVNFRSADYSDVTSDPRLTLTFTPPVFVSRLLLNQAANRAARY